MLATITPTPFKQIIRSLHSKHHPNMMQVIDYLGSLRKRGQAAVILSKLDPEKFEQVCSGKYEMEVGDLSDDPLIEATLGVINDMARLDLEAMSMRFEDGCPDELYPECLGYPMSWDEWEEIQQGLGNYNDSMALFVFVTAMRLDEGNVLLAASEYYGWDLDFDEIEKFPNPNWDRLYTLLDQHDLGCFKNAIDVCLYSTGNPYFDYNPYDESEYYGLPAFTVEGVEELQTAWEAAEPILKDSNAACDRFYTNPSLAQVLFMLYQESAEESPARPQTLAEMWAGDGDEQVEMMVDPFYGPIGLAENQEEENE